jgi:hypothetical protein
MSKKQGKNIKPNISMSKSGVKKVDKVKRERNHMKKKTKQNLKLIRELLDEYLLGVYSGRLEEIQRLEHLRRVREERKKKIASILK